MTLKSITILLEKRDNYDDTFSVAMAASALYDELPPTSSLRHWWMDEVDWIKLTPYTLIETLKLRGAI